MLDELTIKQENLLNVVADEYINIVHSGNTEIDKPKAIETITTIYKIADLQSPQVVFVGGPIAAKEFCREKINHDIKTFDYIGSGFDSGWISFYDYFQRIGILEENDKDFNTIKDFLKSGVWSAILFENLVICIPRPNLVCVDEKGNLHNSEGPAIRFDDGYEEYSWHGTWVSAQIIMGPQTLTQEDIISEKNSEVSRAIAEHLGWEEYLKRVDSILIHKWFDETTKNHYELYDFKTRKGSLQPRLLKMESPELNDGTRPYYIEPVPPEAESCQAARRWQCDPTIPDIKECNKHPELVFEIER